MNSDKKIFCYAKPNMMVGHKFTDDVALCRADSLEQAIELFSKYYDKSILYGNITEVDFNKNEVRILTDY